MAKELGRKLGKTLVADGWKDEVLGVLWKGKELFGGQTWKLRTTRHTSSAMLSVAILYLATRLLLSVHLAS
jgi:hypothetical protein